MIHCLMMDSYQPRLAVTDVETSNWTGRWKIDVQVDSIKLIVRFSTGQLQRIVLADREIHRHMLFETQPMRNCAWQESCKFEQHIWLVNTFSKSDIAIHLQKYLQRWKNSKQKLIREIQNTTQIYSRVHTCSPRDCKWIWVLLISESTSTIIFFCLYVWAKAQVRLTSM